MQAALSPDQLHAFTQLLHIEQHILQRDYTHTHTDIIIMVSVSVLVTCLFMQ